MHVKTGLLPALALKCVRVEKCVISLFKKIHVKGLTRCVPTAAHTRFHEITFVRTSVKFNVYACVSTLRQ